MTITVVKDTNANAAGGTGALTITPGAAYASGALLVVTSSASSAGAITSITGGGVTTWNLVRSDFSAGFRAEIWYGYNSGGGSAAVVVTYTTSGAKYANCIELGGAIASGVATDGVNGASGINGTSINSGNVTPTAATEVIIFNSGAFQAATAAVAGPSGWTSLTSRAPSTQYPSSYKIVTSASGSYNATYAIGYNRFGVNIAAFKAGGGGGGGNRRRRLILTGA
jgi:hypothetical protein